MEKILVIDDDESILVLLKKLLGEFNCELHEAETGQDGQLLVIGIGQPQLDQDF